MYRRLVFLLFVLAFGLAVSAQAATIIWVSDAYDDDTDTVTDDLGFVTLLRAQGYTVDYRGEGGASDPNRYYWRTLDASKIALLDAADLVIVSRCLDTASYNNDATERAAWSGIKAPLLMLPAHLYRNSRWRWLNTTNTTNTTDNLRAMLPSHPVFAGVTLGANNEVSIVNATTSVGDGTLDPTNTYTLIAVRATAGADGVWIAFWEPNLEFYPGSGERTGGPRMYLACGTQETAGSVGRGEYNLTTEGEKLFLNAVDYMVKWDQVNASRPIPASGAPVPPTGKVPGGVYMLLQFQGAETAVTHTAYFSEDFDDVNDRNPAVRLGSPPYPGVYPTGYYVGLDVPDVPAFARVPLTAGKTYYWAVDESNGTTTFPGKVWSFKIVPEQAWDPGPADGAKYVDARTGVALSWKLGSIITTGYNVSYDVYYGTAFANVNTGTTPTVHVTAATTTTAPLASQTLYYWRVDTILTQVAPPFGTTKTKGDVWRFETLLVVPVTDPNLVGWWKLDGDFESFVFDHSGHANHGTAQGGVGWVAGYNDNAADFDGADDYVELPRNIVGSAVGTMAMWIRTTQSADGTVFYGTQTDGDGYGTQNEVHVNVVPGGGARLYIQGSPSVSLISSAVNDNEWHHIAAAWDTTVDARLYVDGGSAGATAHTGSVFPAAGYVRLGRPASATRYYDGLLDDVRLYDYALSAKTIKVLAGRLTAASPDPANIATGVARTPTLSWEAGAYAANVNGHNLYFSDNRDSVINRTTAKIVRTDPCYPVATILDFGKTYYWAVDEVNNLHADKMWPGDLWSFTTINYLVVDDMEKYVPNVANPTVYQVWVDGAGDCASIPGNNSGALVDISTLTALGPVHGDQQAMKLLYDNDGTVNNPCPPGGPTARLTYSKAEALVAKLPGIGSDWTSGGVTKALSLWFYGDPLNSIEPMWVRLTDASNNTAKVLYGKYADEDVKDVNEASWHEWLIDLADFTGVNVGNVKSIAIGIGNETGPAGGSGTLYFDDIRLYIPRCALARRSADFAPFDYVGDCKVDYRELERMTSQWLVGPETEVAWAPFGTWSHADIGSTATAGGFTNNGDGSYSITGSGADIWGTADAFHYVYKPLVGDGQMTVNVVNITGTSTNVWQKAGVMIRETLAAGSRNVMMLMSVGPGAASTFAGGDAFQWRPVTDQASSSSHSAADNIAVLMPNCVRLVRTGNMFSGFVYVNGQWVQEGQTVTIAMPETVYVGLAVTSHDNAAGIYTTATFNSVCDSSFGGLLPDLTGGDDRVNFVDYAALMDRFLDEDLFP